MPTAPVKAKPRISVLDRRLQNPFGEPSSPVELKDPSLRPRWFNGAIMNDKIWRAKHKGWTPVKPTDIADMDQIGAHNISPDGFVTRGERGQEVLMSMPKDDYHQIELAKDRHNRKHMGRGATDDVLEAASQQFGEQTAERMRKEGGPIGNVIDTYERVERREVE